MPRPSSGLLLAGSALHPAQLDRPVVGRTAADNIIEISLLVRGQNREHRAEALRELAATEVCSRAHWMHADIAARLGIAGSDLERIRQFARLHGLEIREINRLARTVRLRADVATLSRLFGVELVELKHELGPYRAHPGQIRLPAEIHDLVDGVTGFDTAPLCIPHVQRHPKHVQTGVPPDPKDVLHYTPPQLADIYRFPVKTGGRGVSIGLLAFAGGLNSQDLQSYFGRLNFAQPAIVEVSVDGAATRFTGNWMLDGEVTLDVEVLGGAAPNAQLVVYHAPNTSDGWLQAVHRVISDEVNRPAVLSISWGQVETKWPNQAIQAMEEAFTTAALLGITVCASAGDHGSADGFPQGAHVNYPASSPWVLACGGTKLLASNNQIEEETVWNEMDNEEAVFRGATGGGVSEVFPPPDYQSDADIPPSYNDSTSNGRGVPDVAANADPNSGYLVTVDGITTVSGGTSAATPMWAALVARINEALGRRVGLLHPTIYAWKGGKAFHAITTGSNGAYAARPGWDACTGWGSPRGEVLLQALQESAGGS